MSILRNDCLAELLKATLRFRSQRLTNEHRERDVEIAKSDAPPPISAVLDIPGGASRSSPPTAPIPPSRSCPPTPPEQPRRPDRRADHRRLRRRRGIHTPEPQKPALGPLRIPGGHRPATGRLASRARPPAPSSAASARPLATSPSRRTARSRSTRPRSRLTATDGDVEVGRAQRPRGDQHRKGRLPDQRAVRGTIVLRTQSGDIVAAPAASRPPRRRGTGYGRISNALRTMAPPISTSAPHFPRRHHRPQPLKEQNRGLSGRAHRYRDPAGRRRRPGRPPPGLAIHAQGLEKSSETPNATRWNT